MDAVARSGRTRSLPFVEPQESHKRPHAEYKVLWPRGSSTLRAPDRSHVGNVGRDSVDEFSAVGRDPCCLVVQATNGRGLQAGAILGGRKLSVSLWIAQESTSLGSNVRPASRLGAHRETLDYIDHFVASRCNNSFSPSTVAAELDSVNLSTRSHGVNL